MNKLSYAITAVAVNGVLFASASLAQSGPELLLNPMTKGITADGNVSAAYFFDSNTDFDDINDSEDFELQRYTLNTRFRLMPDHKADPRIGFSGSFFYLGENPVLPKSFTDVSISVGTGIFEHDGWVGGLTLGAGWAGANEFGESDAFYGTATLLVGRELRKDVSLGLALDYNGNRTFMPDTPLPGVVLTWQLPEQKLELSAGFPFAYGRWRPIDKLLLEINFTFPDFVGARLSYDLVEGVGVFASLAKRNDAWEAAGLENDVDRILFEQTGAEFGARFSLHDRFTLLIAGGYAFKQEFGVGFDTRDTDKIAELDDGPFVRIEGQFAF